MSSNDTASTSTATSTSTAEAPPPTARTPREFEQFLRQHGYSKAAARGITMHGFKPRDLDAVEHEAEEAELLSALDALRRAISGADRGEV